MVRHCLAGFSDMFGDVPHRSKAMELPSDSGPGWHLVVYTMYVYIFVVHMYPLYCIAKILK